MRLRRDRRNSNRFVVSARIASYRLRAVALQYGIAQNIRIALILQLGRALILRRPRLFGQFFRFDEWSLRQG